MISKLFSKVRVGNFVDQTLSINSIKIEKILSEEYIIDSFGERIKLKNNNQEVDFLSMNKTYICLYRDSFNKFSYFQDSIESIKVVPEMRLSIYNPDYMSPVKFFETIVKGKPVQNSIITVNEKYKLAVKYIKEDTIHCVNEEKLTFKDTYLVLDNGLRKKNIHNGDLFSVKFSKSTGHCSFYGH